jgi:hypothetical protein
MGSAAMYFSKRGCGKNIGKYVFGYLDGGDVR